MNRKFLIRVMTRKVMAAVLTLSLGISMLPVQSISLAAGSTATEEMLEDENYTRLEIRTVQDFADFVSQCYIDSWSKDKYVVLMEDIDLTDAEYETVPVFNGIFDGNGKTISGFDYVGTGYVVGLFRYIESNGIVKDLNLRGNIESENEQECIGSIAGINYGTIRNCTFIGTVSGQDTVGGIVGTNEKTGTISNCTSKGRITGYYSTGGVAGINHGAINSCTNRAGVNDNVAWVEEDDEMGGVEMVKNLVSSDDDEVYSGVDTGGIAGYSDGVIARCTNSGVIGYEHTGYNIGGIAGRQAGVVTLCTNNGRIYGRKDVGGIVGQMEPDIEINEAESLRDNIDKLHDLVNKTLDDMTDTKNVITNDVEIMRQFADAAVDTGDDLITKITDFADDNIDETNTLTSRMEHVMDMLPDVLDNATKATDAAKRLNDVLKQLSDDVDVMAKLDNSAYDETQYNRVSTLSTVGGTIATDVSNPESGDTVTITVLPNEGYKLKSGTKPTVMDTNGKAIAVTAKNDSDTKYTFTMPEENVRVSAEFEYEGRFLLKSTIGGTLTETKNGDDYTFRVSAASGYNNPTEIAIDGKSYDLGGDDRDEVTLTKGKDFNFNGESIVVDAEFTKKNETLYDVNVVTGTGGTAYIVGTSNSAGAGDTITIGVTAFSNYQYDVKDIKVNGKGKDDGLDIKKNDDNASQYDITMPDIDGNSEYTITVTFTYKYEDNKDTTVYVESSAGGMITARQASGTSDYNVTISANSGYDVATDDALTITQYTRDTHTNSSTTTKNKDKLTKSDSENTNTYTYVLTSEDYNKLNQVCLYAKFVKMEDGDDANKNSVRTFSSTGGTIATDMSRAEENDTVNITPASTSGYVLTSLTMNGTELTSSNGKTYTFTMPSGEARVEAVFAPIDVRLSSNLSGNATYSGNSKGVVTLTVSPDTSYTLDGAPTVKDGGTNVPISKKSSGSYVYEFSVADKADDIYNVNIVFKQQSNKQTIDTANDEIDDEIDDLTKQSDNVQKSVEKIRDIITDSDDTIKTWDELSGTDRQNVINEVLNLADYMGDMSTSTASILRNITTIYNILEPYVSDAADAARDDADKAGDEVQSAVAALNDANDAIKSIVNYVNGQSDIKFSKLGEDFDASKELFHDQLKALSDSIKTLNDNASAYSDLINDDLKAVNDQLNVVFNLLADRLTDAEEVDLDNIYSDVTDEDIDEITNGRVEYSKNTGFVQGDINIGGIAGSMSIDSEDPEDSAAGNVEYRLGSSYIAKCLIIGSKNEGYITAKKDGAGGICGYMDRGLIVDCEGYGSVESTEGDYVGGICGQSLTIIKRCYSLCSVSGGQNVGGIAGYADTLTDCYAMANVSAENGRVGAIAGQVASYDEVSSESVDESHVANNYYVNDEMYGIDNISYVGVAEPISYQNLLAVENIPTEFWHLKVIYMIEDTYLGTQEVAYGEKLDNLSYPSIPVKEGYYGVWPDMTGKVMGGTTVIEAEYKDSVTVVKSTGVENEKSLALVEDNFTENTVLVAKKVDMTPPVEIEDKEYVVYELSIEDGTVKNTDTFAIRLLNPYGDDAEVYAYTDGEWVKVESKVRGQYLQVEMTGAQQYFCVVNEKSDYIILIACIAAGVVALIVIIILIKKISSLKKKKKLEKQQQNDN